MSDLMMPPAPPPAPSPLGPTTTPRPRRGLVLGAAVAAMLVLVGAVAFVATQGDEAEAGPLTLSFTAGETHRYRIDQTMDLTVGGDALGAEERSLLLELEQVVAWSVTDVDDEGVATIRVDVEDVNGSVNGMPAPPSGPLPPIELRIAPDGRVLSIGGPALGGTPIDLTRGGLGQLFDVPGSNQVTPLLPPDGDARPGDTWETSISQDVPFGDGTVELEATSRYDRDEEVDGATAAVIETGSNVTADIAFAVADLAELFGGAGALPTGATGLAAVADAAMTYGGTVATTQTSWLDLEARELVRMESSGEMDLEMEISGVPGSSGTITVSGTYDQALARA